MWREMAAGDPDAASTTMLIWELAAALGAERDRIVATCCYTGHIHRDEHLAGTLIGRRGHKTVEAGQEGQIARGLLLAATGIIS